MKIVDVRAGKAVQSVNGVVRHVWKIRDCQSREESESSWRNDLIQFTDNGPLAEKTKRVLSVCINSFRGDTSTAREGSAEIMIYFYDTWAEMCSFLTDGDVLTVSGPAEMVLDAPVEEKDDFPYCLVFYEDSESACELKLEVESKSINTNTRCFTFTNDIVLAKSGPRLIDWNSHSKQRKQKSRASPSTAKMSTKKGKGAQKKSNSDITAPVTSSPLPAKTSTALPSLAYTYTPISDISDKSLEGQQLNIYGVIHTYQQPKITRGSHKFSCSYTLIDPSCVISHVEGMPSENSEWALRTLVFIFFANELDSFPPVKRVGDIVRLHRVKVSIFQNKYQILGWETRSSFLHFHHKAPHFQDCVVENGKNCDIQEGERDDLNSLVEKMRKLWELTSSSDKYSFSADAVAAVNSMQNFVLSVFPKPLLSYSNNRSDAVDIAEYMINIQDLNRQQRMGATDQPSSKPLDLTNLDAVLLLVSIRGDSAPAKGQVPSVLHLLVWDGSDTGGGYITPQGGGPDDMVVDAATVRVALQAVKSVQSILGDVNPKLSSSTFLAGGYAVISVTMKDAPMQLRAVASLTPGTWIRLQHFCRVPGGGNISPRNIIGDKTAINVLSPFFCDVKNLVQKYTSTVFPNCSAIEGAMGTKATSIPPVLGKRRLTSSSGHTFSPLAFCLAAPSPSSFHVLVGIRSFYPTSFSSIVLVHRVLLPSSKETVATEDNTQTEIREGKETETLLESPIATQMETVTEETLVDAPGDSPPQADSTSNFSYTYMFSLCIYDDTACCDAIVYSRDGDRLLGDVTAEQLYHNPSLQQSYQKQLEKAIEDGATFEFEIVTYLTASQPPPACIVVNEENPLSIHSKVNEAEETDLDRPILKRVRLTNSSFFQQIHKRLQ